METPKYSFSTQQNSIQPEGYIRRNKSRNSGCLRSFGVVAFLAIFIFVGIYFGYPALTPNKIHGNFLSMALVPLKDGSQNIWILTDGSFNFIQTTKSPGSYSTGRKCFFCKTWTYVYDPASEQILKKIKTEQSDIITKIDIFYNKGQVWQVTMGYGKNEPKIDIYDAATYEKVMDTKAFISKYDILSSGLASVRYDEKGKYVSFDTKDGNQQVTYSIEDDKLYDNYADYLKTKRESKDVITTAVLSPESSSSKKFKLYKLTGPRGKVESNRSSLEHFVFENTKNSVFTEGIDVQPTTDKGYIEGILYYTDDDCSIVIYVDQIGRKADRYMTCVDMKTGKEKWTAGPDMLFKKMKIDKDSDSFSDIFFTKDKIKVRRSGNIVVVEMEGEGLIGFDYNTGKQIWELSI